jgi:CRP-like cAMP-binding protein
MAERPETHNGLLSALQADVLAGLLPKFETVTFQAHQSLSRPETSIDAVYFLESGWISMVASLDDGAPAEVGLIGREGMVPLPLVLGVETSFVDTYVQGGGTALRMGAEAFKAEMASLPSLKALLLRYSEAMHAQSIQAAVCNGRHALKQRLARWLLMAHDRIDGDEVQITQDSLALMLCVYRPSVSVAARSLQRAAIIRHHSGKITILDRPALEAAACGCYRADAARSRHLLS